MKHAPNRQAILDESEVFTRASRALRNYNQRNGYRNDEPSKDGSGFDGGVMVLRNAYRELGRYNVDASGRLRRLAEKS